MIEQNEPALAERKAMIERCFAAYNSKDRAAIEDLLADTFTFTSPYDDAINRQRYFEICWPNSGRIRKHVIERIFVEGNEAFVTYEATTFEGMQFRNTEFFSFKDRQIESVTVYFGASYKDGAFIKKQQ